MAGEHWRTRSRRPRGEVGAFTRLSDPDEIAPFLSDAAHYPGGSSPELCFPTNEAEVAAILAEGRPLLVVAAQSSLTGGATPRGETLVSTARLDGLEFKGSDAVVAGAGVVLHTLCEAASERGCAYPPVPTFDGATVGGTAATNAAGAATFKYGTTRDWVRGLTVVLASGEVLDLERGAVHAHPDGYFEIEDSSGGRTRIALPRLRMPAVPKNSAGYFIAPGMDLVDLFLGSEGTLGVITEVRLRLLERRPEPFAAWVPVAGDREALALAASLRRAARTRASGSGTIDLAAIEFADRCSLELAREAGAYERAGVSLPVDCGAAVLVQAELPAGTSAEQARAEIASFEDPARGSSLAGLCRLLAERGLLDAALPALPGEERRRASLFALREAVPEAVNARVRERQRTRDPSISKAAADVIVPFERLEEALARYRAVAARHALELAVWGHVSDGNLHPNFLPEDGAQMKACRQALLAIGEVAIELGGSPMSEHGVGRNEVKKRLLVRLYGERGVRGMESIKRTLDPRSLLAPGVMF